MLNIPDEIKALYKTDSVRKNFRVHFPNGENPDLTNSDIVAGSVSFTESVCSKDVLQFGLAEASRIEFECVNVPNIYGAVIECYNEIDATDADAQYQTTMPDLDYPVYQIPLGVFTVSSCPRSAGAMWKRRVEAYGRDIANAKESTLLYRKLGTVFTVPTIQQNIPNLFAQELNNVPFATTSSTLTMGSTNVGSSSMGTLSWTYNGDNYTISPSVLQQRNYYFYNTYGDSINDLYKFTCDADTSVIDEIYEDVRNLGFFEDPSNSEYVYPAFRCMFEPCGVFAQPTDSAEYRLAMTFDSIEDSGWLYPHSDGNHYFTIVYPNYTLDFELKKNGTLEKTYHVVPYITNASLKKYNATDTRLQKMNITVESTRDYGNGDYAFYNAVDVAPILEGFGELNAKFIHANRQSENEMVVLSKASPVSMSTDEYSSLWWDEYDISPIGSVEVSYKDADLNQDQVISYSLGTGGQSVYQMTDNYILKNITQTASELGESTYNFVTGLIEAYFKPNVTDIAFTPVQFSSLGLPYLEAGDYLEIDDGNGGTVGTYIMSRTLSGVQFLEDDIESKGGEIIGNVRSA